MPWQSLLAEEGEDDQEEESVVPAEGEGRGPVEEAEPTKVEISPAPREEPDHQKMLARGEAFRGLPPPRWAPCEADTDLPHHPEIMEKQDVPLWGALPRFQEDIAPVRGTCSVPPSMPVPELAEGQGIPDVR